MKVVLLIISIISGGVQGTAYSQIVFEHEEEKKERALPIHSLYLDIFGNAYSYSLNYEVINKHNLGFRVGITPYFDFVINEEELPNNNYRNDRFSQSFLLIGMINYYFGTGLHRLETGLGMVFSVNDRNIRPGLPSYPAMTGTIGYRIIPYKEDITLRIAFTPILSGDKLYPHIGFSIGYIF